MTDINQMRLSSLIFAVLWTATMWWWNRPFDTAQIVILVICGVLCGLGWHFGYGRWFRWYFRRSRKAAH